MCFNRTSSHQVSQKFVILGVFVMKGPEFWFILPKVHYTEVSLYREYFQLYLLFRIQGTGLWFVIAGSLL